MFTFICIIGIYKVSYIKGTVYKRNWTCDYSKAFRAKAEKSLRQKNRLLKRFTQ